MSDASPIPDWMATVEDLNREIGACLDRSDWDQVPVLQARKDTLLGSEGVRSLRAGPGTPGARVVARLAQQEEAILARIAAIQERMRSDLQKIDASANLSRRFRSSYGSRDPGDANWERFS